MALLYRLNVGDKVMITEDGRDYEMTVSRIYDDPTIGLANRHTVTLSIRPGGWSTVVRPDTAEKSRLRPVTSAKTAAARKVPSYLTPRTSSKKTSSVNPEVDGVWYDMMLDYPSDEFGTVMEYLFAVADTLHFVHGAEVPPEWQYRPGLGYDNEAFAYQAVAGLSVDDLLELGRRLDVLYDELVAAGKDY